MYSLDTINNGTRSSNAATPRHRDPTTVRGERQVKSECAGAD